MRSEHGLSDLHSSILISSNQLSKLLLPTGKRMQHLYHCQQRKVTTCRKCNSVPVNKQLYHEFTGQPLRRHDRVLSRRFNIRRHPLTGIIPVIRLHFRTMADVTKSICNSLISCHEGWKRWAVAVSRCTWHISDFIFRSTPALKFMRTDLGSSHATLLSGSSSVVSGSRTAKPPGPSLLTARSAEVH